MPFAKKAAFTNRLQKYVLLWQHAGFPAWQYKKAYILKLYALPELIELM